MSIQSVSEDEEEQSEQDNQPQAHHPSAPPDELFDISTTVDPSYVIALIRKLLPSNMSSSNKRVDVCDSLIHGSKADEAKESVTFPPKNENLNPQNDEYEAMVTVQDFGEIDGPDIKDDSSYKQDKHEDTFLGEEAWEEYGCILWDLAASKTHAELMVENLVLEVLLTNLMVFRSVRITEISLGIIGNLACHEVLQKHVASTKGLIEVIVDQLFVDDTPCISEACRLLTLCLQSSEGVTWAEALQSEHVLSRILWIAENTLNTMLMEKCVGLLLAVIGLPEVISLLLPRLMKLGLPRLLINLLAFEMNKLMGERVPERYSVTYIILRTIEALSVLDGFSEELCSSKELFQLLIDLIKLPDKIEVANSCVAAAVLTANILTDAADLALEISQDVYFLQGLLDLFPFASDDTEARSALWSIISRSLERVQEDELSISSLHQFVSVLISKSDLIEEQLFDNELDDSNGNHESLIASAKLNLKTTALSRISSLLNKWKASKDQAKGSDITEENFVDGDVDRLLETCRKYTKLYARPY